jgi:hypothetical protein
VFICAETPNLILSDVFLCRYFEILYIMHNHNYVGKLSLWQKFSAREAYHCYFAVLSIGLHDELIRHKGDF